MTKEGLPGNSYSSTPSDNSDSDNQLNVENRHENRPRRRIKNKKQKGAKDESSFNYFTPDEDYDQVPQFADVNFLLQLKAGF